MKSHLPTAERPHLASSERWTESYIKGNFVSRTEKVLKSVLSPRRISTLKGRFQPAGSLILSKLRTHGCARKEPEYSQRSGLPRGDAVADVPSNSHCRDYQAYPFEHMERFCNDPDLVLPRRSRSSGTMSTFLRINKWTTLVRIR